MMEDVSGWKTRLDASEIARHRASGQWKGRTLADEARSAAERTPDRTAIQCGDDLTYSYADLLARGEALASGFWEIGLRPGDVISFQLPNWIEAAALDIAAVLLGLVVNPIVPIYRNSEVAVILRDCRAKAIVIPETFRGFDFVAMMAALGPTTPDLKHVIVARGASRREGTLAFEDLARGGAAVPWPKQRPEAIKLVMYTSGTTGRPKGVLHTHETLVRAGDCAGKFWDLNTDDIVLMPSPVTHVTGFSWGIEHPFRSGIRSILMERWDAAEAVELIDKHGATMTVGATPFLAELIDAAERAGSRLPAFKVFACGGAAVPPAVVRRANALFAKGRAFRVYGATEAPLITLGFVGSGTEDLAAETDGKIIDYEVRVVDDAGRTLAQGREGEILCKGSALLAGYTDPAETNASFTADGFFRMGDIGYVTPDNAVVITGRKKDLIIRGGENISAKEIEDALHKYVAVREAAVVSMPHARLGETVCAYVISAKGHAPTREDIATYLGAFGLAKQKIPERVELVDDFPRTASGKIKKDILRARIAETLRSEAL
jgi:cyclohexanecarboxylate-CoA ligase